jgi:hypothetical protein
MIFTYADAILNIRPEALFDIRGNQYDTLQWYDTVQDKPEEIEINAELNRLIRQYQANEYQRKRAEEYPSIIDQLDLLYHVGYDGWKETIQTIKDKYPKV